MEQISDKHFGALLYLAKANNDLSRAIQFLLNKKYADAYGETLRVRESIRLILEVDKELTPDDENE
jgi:hypothetical protein